METVKRETAADYAGLIEPLLSHTDSNKAQSARMWIAEAANILPKAEFLKMASLLQITVSKTKKAARQELIDFVNRLWVMNDATRKFETITRKRCDGCQHWYPPAELEHRGHCGLFLNPATRPVVMYGSSGPIASDPRPQAGEWCESHLAKPEEQ